MLTQKKIPHNKTTIDINCFGFYRDKQDRPKCHALEVMLCLTGDCRCKFRATPEEAEHKQMLAQERLARLGIRDKY